MANPTTVDKVELPVCPPTPILLLLTGVEDVEKSAYAAHLVKEYGFIDISFADALREVTAEIWNGIAYGISWSSRAIESIDSFDIETSKDAVGKHEPLTFDEEDYSDQTRELRFRNLDPRFRDRNRQSITHQGLVDWVGTDILCHHLGADIWVNAAMKKIEKVVHANPNGYHIVVSDCSRENEERIVNETYPHATLVKISEPCWKASELIMLDRIVFNCELTILKKV